MAHTHPATLILTDKTSFRDGQGQNVSWSASKAVISDYDL